MSNSDGPEGGRVRPLLSRDEWQRLEPLVDALLDSPPDRRTALLSELSGDDSALRAELERLVAECELEYPALEQSVGSAFAIMLEDEMPPMPESLAGRYQILREVGRGGMAIVYLARDLKHGRDVAVKVVRPSLAAALGRARFLREIQIAARLRHPHIMPVYDSGEVPVEPDEGSAFLSRAPLLYYVMPFEPGQSLRERLTRDGPMPVQDVVQILRDVCEALAHAHQHGIVHRDIKPDNVLLSGHHAVVTDFGVAGAVSAATVEPTTAGASTVAGTPAYMAPEQAAGPGHRIDHRADIYAVGVLAYELLAGRPPLADSAPQSPALSRMQNVARVPTSRSRLPARMQDVARAATSPATVPARMQDVARAATSPAKEPARMQDVTRAATSLPPEPAHLQDLVEELTSSSGEAARVGELARASSSLSAVLPRVRDVATELTAHRPDVPHALAALIAKCLAPRPGDRWQSADELLANLAPSVVATDSTAARPHRSWALAGGAGVAALMVVAVVAVVAVVWLGDRAERPALLIGRASQLTSERGLEVQPTISADGRYVAYAVGNSLRMRIAIRPTTGGPARWLTADTTANQWLPRWSPDGGRILFLSSGGVSSVRADGRLVRQEIASRPGAIVSSATWSPDGRQIAYVRGDSLLSRTLASGATRLIATGADLHSCRWSPDGIRLACVSGNSFYATVGAVSGIGSMFGNLAPSRIVIVPAAGGPPVSVTDSGSLHQSPVWSPDGQTLFYVSNRQGPRDVYALDVGGRSPADGEPARVTAGMGAQSIDFSADGARMVYVAYSSTANVWSMPIPARPPGSDTTAVPVTTGNQTVEGVRVSPDGRWLVYDSDLSGNSDLYRVPVTGGEAERLTRGPTDEFRGVISPDGRALAYHSFRTGARDIFLLPLDSGSHVPVRQLTRSTGQWTMPNWSPDGTAIAFFDMASARILVMRRDRQGRWGAPQFVGGRGWRAEWSPDGRTIAFISPTDGRIATVPADSGRQRDIYVPGDGDPLAELAVFAASGRELYFKSHDVTGRASFWSISISGGRPRLLVRFDDPGRPSNRFDFASDGRRFYFTLEDRQSDTWVADVGWR